MRFIGAFICWALTTFAVQAEGTPSFAAEFSEGVKRCAEAFKTWDPNSAFDDWRVTSAVKRHCDNCPTLSGKFQSQHDVEASLSIRGNQEAFRKGWVSADHEFTCSLLRFLAVSQVSSEVASEAARAIDQGVENGDMVELAEGCSISGAPVVASIEDEAGGKAFVAFLAYVAEDYAGLAAYITTDRPDGSC